MEWVRGREEQVFENQEKNVNFKHADCANFVIKNGVAPEEIGGIVEHAIREWSV